MDEWIQELIGKKVEVKEGTNSRFDNKVGVITSIDSRTVLPIHVTLEGENSETDFRFQELVVLE